MKRRAVLAGACALISIAWYVPGSASDSSVHSESASCNVTINGYRVTGEIRFSFQRDGANFYGVTSEYRISGADHGRNKANINIAMRVWDDSTPKEGGGKYYGQVKSADAMRQDGAWHALNLKVGGNPGFTVKSARFGTEFIFDTASSDPDCTANYETAL